MSRAYFISRVEEFCELPSHSLKGDESLQSSLLIDSLALLGLVSMLDKDFGVQFTINEIMDIGTLDNLYSRVEA